MKSEQEKTLGNSIKIKKIGLMSVIVTKRIVGAVLNRAALGLTIILIVPAIGGITNRLGVVDA